MKKIVLLITCCIVCLGVKAQINLMHTFEGNVSVFSDSYYMDNIITFPEKCYVKLELGNNNEYYRATVYDTDFSINNVETFNLPSPPTGYSIYSFFNNDDYYEYLMVFGRYDLYDDNRNKMILYDHNYNVIKDFGSSYSISASSCHSTGGTAHIIDNYRIFSVTRQNASYNSFTDIYYILGVDNISENIVESSKAPFPNPANQIVYIPCESQKDAIISIFDINGKLIETKQGNCSNDGFLLDVKNYPPGIYIYECNGERNRFIKQ